MITLTKNEDGTVTLAAPAINVSVTTAEFSQEVTVRQFCERLAARMFDELIPDCAEINRLLSGSSPADVLNRLEPLLSREFEILLFSEHTDNQSIPCFRLFSINRHNAVRKIAEAGELFKKTDPRVYNIVVCNVAPEYAVRITRADICIIISVSNMRGQKDIVEIRSISTIDRKKIVQNLFNSLSRYIALEFPEYTNRIKVDQDDDA